MSDTLFGALRSYAPSLRCPECGGRVSRGKSRRGRPCLDEYQCVECESIFLLSDCEEDEMAAPVRGNTGPLQDLTDVGTITVECDVHSVGNSGFVCVLTVERYNTVLLVTDFKEGREDELRGILVSAFLADWPVLVTLSWADGDRTCGMHGEKEFGVDRVFKPFKIHEVEKVGPHE